MRRRSPPAHPAALGRCARPRPGTARRCAVTGPKRQRWTWRPVRRFARRALDSLNAPCRARKPRHMARCHVPRASRITHRASRMAYRASMLATARAERRSIRIRPCRTLLPSPRYVAPIRPRAPRHMRQSVENSIEEPLDDSIAGSVDHSPPQEAIRSSGSTRSIPGNNARRRVEGRSAGERAEDIADTSHWLPERPARRLSRSAGCIRARADASVRAQSRNARDRASGDIVDAAMPRSHVAIREAAIAAVRSSFGDCALRSRGGSFSRRRRCACPCVPPR